MYTPTEYQLTPSSRGLLRLMLLVTLTGSGCELVNNPPSVSISTEEDFALTGSRQTLTAVTEDIDEDVLRISWRATGGTLSKITGEVVQWTAPLDRGVVTITVIADDRKSGIDSASTTITVVNDAPIISDFSASDNHVLLGNTIDLTVTAEDPDGEEITYSFATSPAGIGKFPIPDGLPTTTWTAPTVDDTPFARVYDIVAKAKDEKGFFATDTIRILVYPEHGTLWIADSRHSRVSKYSDRGDFILTSAHAFTKPVALAQNISSPYISDYGAYVADFGSGEVVKIGPNGNMEYVVSGLPNVTDIAHHFETGTLWALAPGDSSLTIIDLLTDSHPIIRTIYGFEQPKVIKINQNSGDVWILDAGKNIVVQLDANNITTLPDTITTLNTPIFENQLNGPADLAVLDQKIGATVYIADKRDLTGDIEQLVSTGGAYAFSSSFATYNLPSLIVASVVAEVWVANSSGSVTRYEVVSGVGAPFGLFSYDFKNPHTMQADPETGEVWIGDNGSNEVVKMIALSDSVDVVISGFGFIEDMVINKER